jgi:hypothetical protein
MLRGRQIGGIGHWTDDRVFVLPDSMSELDFVNTITRDQTFKTQAGAGPTMNLRNAFPVWIGGSQYRWETGWSDCEGCQGLRLYQRCDRAMSVLSVIQPSPDEQQMRPAAPGSDLDAVKSQGWWDSTGRNIRIGG